VLLWAQGGAYGVSRHSRHISSARAAVISHPLVQQEVPLTHRTRPAKRRFHLHQHVPTQSLAFSRPTASVHLAEPLELHNSLPRVFFPLNVTPQSPLLVTSIRSGPSPASGSFSQSCWNLAPRLSQSRLVLRSNFLQLLELADGPRFLHHSRGRAVS